MREATLVDVVDQCQPQHQYCNGNNDDQEILVPVTKTVLGSGMKVDVLKRDQIVVNMHRIPFLHDKGIVVIA